VPGVSAASHIFFYGHQGDPKECRRHAARCAEMAVAARTPQLKATFLGLSKNWETLAIQLENAFTQLPKMRLFGRRSKSPWTRLAGFGRRCFDDYTTFDRSGAPRAALVIQASRLLPRAVGRRCA
jgi:hypothetical protein